MTTLQSLQAKLSDLQAELDAYRRAEDVQSNYFEFAGTRYPLERGEVYVCTLAHSNLPPTHTILLPFDRDEAPWDEHMAWAKGQGFDLPNRLELLMMCSTMRKRFQQASYWSTEAHHNDSSYAWYQYFDSGYQFYSLKSAALRAVAVRRSREHDHARADR